MRYTILAGLALAALAPRPAAAAAPPAAPLASVLEQQAGVQVWLDGNRDLLYPNDRIRVRARTDRGGYMAVFHIDTNGDLDVLFPRSEWDDGWVDPGRTLSLSTRGGWDYLRVNGGPGIGYVFAVSLDEPLEVWRLRDLYRPRHAGWDPDRSIYGDPFYAMDEVVRAIVPEWALGYEAVDHYTYHVGRRYSYPRYACYDGYGDWYHSRVTYWPTCDRVRIILVNRPYYYDTYRWRGSRRAYYDRYYTTVVRRNRPLHGYKERTESYAPPVREAGRRPQPAGSAGGGSTVRDGGARVARPAPSGGSGADAARRPGGETVRSAPPSGRVRPARPSDGGYSRPEEAPAERGGSYERPAREEPRSRPAEQPRVERPVREAPRERPADAESRRPERESPPPAREAPPARRESPPQRQSAPRQRESAPRSRPSDDGGSRPAPRSRPQADASDAGEASGEAVARFAMYEQDPQDPQDQERQQEQERRRQDRPVESSRERPTFQRRGSSSPPPAQPQREPRSEPRQSPPPQRDPAPPRREAPPQRESGGGSSRPAEGPGSGSRPPAG